MKTYLLNATQRIPKSILDKNTKTLEFYKDYQKTTDLLQRTAIALGRKRVFKTISASTLDCEINRRAIYSVTKS